MRKGVRYELVDGVMMDGEPAYHHLTMDAENLSDFFDTVNPEDVLSLNCSGCELTSLPPEIGKCVRLEKLFCHKNDLAAIPPEIGGCTSLQFFDCSINRLESLPPEIGMCARLRGLICSRNGLTSLPVEIGECTKLRAFDCWYNKLKSLPPEIGNCFRLTELECSENMLETLPPEIGNCSRLEFFRTHNNPFTDEEYVKRLKSVVCPAIFYHDEHDRRIRQRILAPLSDQYPEILAEDIEDTYPDASFELIKMYIETGEFPTTDFPRRKSATKA